MGIKDDILPVEAFDPFSLQGEGKYTVEGQVRLRDAYIAELEARCQKAEVFVLTTGYEYADNTILGVFTTKELAEQAMKDYDAEEEWRNETPFRLHTVTVDKLEAH